MKGKISIGTRIVLIAFIIFFLFFGLNILISTSIFEKEYSDALISKTISEGQSLNSMLMRIFMLGISLDEIVGFEEECQDLVITYKEITSAMVVDLNGRILFHNDPENHGQLIEPYYLSAVKSKKNTVKLRYDDIEKEKHYDITIPVLNINNQHIGAIIIKLPEKVIREKREKIMGLSLMVSIAFLALGLLSLIVIINKWVKKPISILLSGIQRNIREERLEKVEVNSKDELGKLASAFNKLIDEVKKVRGGLETEVKKRTIELAKKVEQLEKFQKFSVGREKKMVELKGEIKRLKGESKNE